MRTIQYLTVALMAGGLALAGVGSGALAQAIPDNGDQPQWWNPGDSLEESPQDNLYSDQYWNDHFGTANPNAPETYNYSQNEENEENEANQPGWRYGDSGWGYNRDYWGDTWNGQEEPAFGAGIGDNESGYDFGSDEE